MWFILHPPPCGVWRGRGKRSGIAGWAHRWRHDPVNTAPFFRTAGESFRLPDQPTPRQVATFLITLRDLLPQLDRDVAAQLAAHSSAVDGSDRAVSRAIVHEAVVAYLVSLMACAVIEARAGVPCFRAHLAGLVPELAILDA